jgi:hypothetical protein
VGSMAPLLGWNERRVNGWVSGGDIILVIHIYICVCMYYIDIFILWYIYIMIYLYHDISRYIATTKKRQKKVIWWYIWYFFLCGMFLVRSFWALLGSSDAFSGGIWMHITYKCCCILHKERFGFAVVIIKRLLLSSWMPIYI